MKYSQYTRQIGGFLIGVAVFASCKKADKHDPLGDAGSTIVKLINGGTVIEPGLNKNPIDFVAVSQTIIGADIRRDIPTEAELNKRMVVVVHDDTAALRMYNDGLIAAGAAPLEILDETWYTVNIPRVGGPGGTYTVVLENGEFAKNIEVTLADATILDPSSNYGIAFTITSSDAGSRLSAEQRTVILIISAKNKYDGIYNLKGRHNRSPYNFPYEVEEMHMVTIGAADVAFFWPDAGNFGHPIGTGPDPINDVSWYGTAISPRLHFDATTDLVTSVSNGGGQTPIVLASGGAIPTSRYDAGTKIIYAYFYYYTAGGQDFSNRGWSDTLTYIGPR